MKAYVVDLKKEYGLQGGELACSLMDNPRDTGNANYAEWKRPALIVVPGGGYAMVSNREGEPVSTSFLARGFQTFVLTYLCGGENGVSYPEQLLELAASVDYVKKHADELGVNKDEVFVVGFSAGGHLTGNLAVEYEKAAELLGEGVDCKPTAVGLSYPVITEEGHRGSYQYLLYGYTDEAKTELLKTLELHKAVTENTPPAFLWAMSKDTAVPPDKNVLLYALALAQKGVDYELHVYPNGFHGSSTGALEINGDNPSLRRTRVWVDDCAAFFRLYVKEPF